MGFDAEMEKHAETLEKLSSLEGQWPEIKAAIRALLADWKQRGEKRDALQERAWQDGFGEGVERESAERRKAGIEAVEAIHDLTAKNENLASDLSWERERNEQNVLDAMEVKAERDRLREHVEQLQQEQDEVNVALGPGSLQLVSNSDRLTKIKGLREENERLKAELEAGKIATGTPAPNETWVDCVARLEAEVERLKAKIRGPSSWPCGICGTPKVLECPVCSKARIEAALAKCDRDYWMHYANGAEELAREVVEALKGGK